VHGTTAGCQTLGQPAGKIAVNPAPDAELAGMAGNVIEPVRFGNSGPAVSNMQSRLFSLGYWVADFDGSYGQVTSQAVLAFQKYNGRPRTGNLSEADAYLLTMQSYKPTSLGGGTGDRIEVDKGRQLWFLIRGGKAVLTVNTSTGSDVPYTETNQIDGTEITGDAHTPTGRFKVYRTYSDGWENGQLGQLYRPRYFSGGVAVHGAPQIPGYPASHGCVRVSTTFMDWVWATNAMPVGSEVWVHD
jgi:peptidoglycan hydrolase-like protein with peptidoglycan-binding domain